MACSEQQLQSPPKTGFRFGGFFLIFILLLLLASCTDYERAGVNSRPFNEPTGWEQNPYGDAFRN